MSACMVLHFDTVWRSDWGRNIKKRCVLVTGRWLYSWKCMYEDDRCRYLLEIVDRMMWWVPKGQTDDFIAHSWGAHQFEGLAHPWPLLSRWERLKPSSIIKNDWGLNIDFFVVNDLERLGSCPELAFSSLTCEPHSQAMGQSQLLDWYMIWSTSCVGICVPPNRIYFLHLSCFRHHWSLLGGTTHSRSECVTQDKAKHEKILIDSDYEK